MGDGRPITSQDLLAYRKFFETCAGLGADAALLAVLVDRLGGRERMEVYPGDLVEDLRKRLDWRDAPSAIGPKFVADRLRSLGFRPTGRDGRGVSYEIRWEQVWNLDPRDVSRQSVDVLKLDGAGLLRLLAEDPRGFLAPRLWCPSCRRITVTLWGDSRGRLDESVPCPECASPTRLLEAGWLEKASERVRQSIRADPTLLPRVKAMWDELHDRAPLPPLPEPFPWLNRAWENAEKLPGRPPRALVYYQLAHAVDALESARVAPEKILELLGEPDKKRRRELFQRLPAHVHRFLGARGPGLLADLPSVNQTRLRDAVQWARRQWTNPMARVRGERPIRKARPASAFEFPPTTKSKLKLPHQFLDVPASCLKCGTNRLERGREGRFIWVRCANCGTLW